MARTKASQFTKRELEFMVQALALDKGLDFLTGGKLNKYSRKAAYQIFKKVLPAALRVASVPAASVGRAAVPLVTNPYVAGTALGLGALQTEMGQDLLAASAQSGADTRRALDMELFNLQAMGEFKAKRSIRSGKKRVNKFAKAVGASVKAIKASSFQGAKKKLSNPKKTFASVVKTVSKVNKGQKVAAKGATGLIAKTARKVLGRFGK